MIKLNNRDAYAKCMSSNPLIAKYKGINVAWFVVNQNCALIVKFTVTFVWNGKA